MPTQARLFTHAVSLCDAMHSATLATFAPTIRKEKKRRGESFMPLGVMATIMMLTRNVVTKPGVIAS